MGNHPSRLMECGRQGHGCQSLSALLDAPRVGGTSGRRTESICLSLSLSLPPSLSLSPSSPFLSGPKALGPLKYVSGSEPVLREESHFMFIEFQGRHDGA